MKKILIIIGILFCFYPLKSRAGTICDDENSAFLISAPKGWVADSKTAKKLGLCIVYHLKGSTFASSPALMYPSISSSKYTGQEAVEEMIGKSSNMLSKKKSDVVIKRAEKIKTEKGINFQIVNFLDGPVPQEYESVAYYAEGNSVLIAVFSTRSKKKFNKYRKGFIDFLENMQQMEVKKDKKNK